MKGNGLDRLNMLESEVKLARTGDGYKLCSNYRNLPSITLLRSLHIFQVDHNIFELTTDQDVPVWVTSFERSWLRA